MWTKLQKEKITFLKTQNKCKFTLKGSRENTVKANFPEKLSEGMHWLGEHETGHVHFFIGNPQVTYTELKMSLAFHLMTTSEQI